MNVVELIYKILNNFFLQVYLKKTSAINDRRKKRVQVKYPHCSTFQTKSSKKRNLLILPQHELRKLARQSGRTLVNGFNHLAKVIILCSFPLKIFSLVIYFNWTASFTCYNFTTFFIIATIN